MRFQYETSNYIFFLFFVIYPLFRKTSVQYMYHEINIHIYLTNAQYFIITRNQKKLKLFIILI